MSKTVNGMGRGFFFKCKGRLLKGSEQKNSMSEAELKFSLAAPQSHRNKIRFPPLANLRSKSAMLSSPPLNLRRDINKCQVKCHGMVRPQFDLHIVVFNF